MARGHVYRRQLAGGRMSKWHAVVDVPKTADRRTQVTRSFATRAEAEGWLAEMVTHRPDQAREGGETTGIYLTRWLDEQAFLRPSTKASYRIHINRYLTPDLGEVPLVRVDRAAVERLVSNLAARGLAAGTVQRVLATLRSAMAQAVRTGLLPANPASGIRVPARVARPARTWTPDEAAMFLRTLGNDAIGVLLRLALTTGMRRGELLGLRWSRVHLDGAFLRVEASRTVVGGVIVEGPPKSRNGNRTVFLDPVTVTQLQRLKPALHPADGEDRLVFTDEALRALSPWFVSRIFDRMIVRAGLPRIRFHDLRHTSATLGLAAGESLKEVSARLGHAGIGITADTYADVLPQTARHSTQRRVGLMTGATVEDAA